MINREHIKDEFKKYVENYDLSDVKIMLKYQHTYYVADNCERIAKSLALSDSDVDLAWTLGMFHDIGRFEQLRRFHTFKDRESVNHAALSADILFVDGLVDTFLQDEEENMHLMEQAVRFHNLYRLPEYLSERERLFADILRDADKVDILRVNCETPRTEIYDLPEEEFLNSEMSDEVYQFMITHSEVDRQYSKTGVDFIMGHIAFVYGLVFEESKKLVKEQGFLMKMLEFESKNPETMKRIQRVRNAVQEYLVYRDK